MQLHLSTKKKTREEDMGEMETQWSRWQQGHKFTLKCYARTWHLATVTKERAGWSPVVPCLAKLGRGLRIRILEPPKSSEGFMLE